MLLFKEKKVAFKSEKSKTSEKLENLNHKMIVLRIYSPTLFFFLYFVHQTLPLIFMLNLAFHIDVFFSLFKIESRQVDKIRSKRGKVPRSSDFKIKNEVKQHLEAVEAESMPLEIQTNFLSESVRKYLELGRAIPGYTHRH